MRSTIQWAGAMLALTACPMAHGLLVVDVGSHTIQATHGQTIDISVSGADAFSSFDLFLHVGDGTVGPIVTGVDLQSGIFAGKNTGQTDNGSDDRRVYYSITNNADFDNITGDGLLVRLTLDGTGIAPGTYSLQMGDIATPMGNYSSLFLDSDISPVSTRIINGSVTVEIPEPATMGVLGGAASVLLRRRRR